MRMTPQGSAPVTAPGIAATMATRATALTEIVDDYRRPVARSGTPGTSAKVRLPDHERLKWLGIWVPVVALGLLMGVLESFILIVYPNRWIAHLAVYGIAFVAVTAGAYIFSNLVFRLVQRQEAEIVRSNRQLAALNAVGAVASESLDLDDILHRTLDKVLELTGADSAEIFLWDEASAELVLRAFRGACPEAFREHARFKLHQGFPGWIARMEKAVVTENLDEQPASLRRSVIEAGFRSFAGVPLKSKGKVVGVLEIASLRVGRLTAESAQLLAALGYPIGIAIENGRLYQHIKEISMLEERQRIAREMHDGLAQQLGYLSLKLAEMEQTPALASGRSDIHMMRKVVAGAYEDVRQAIFGLKVMVSRNLGLVPTLAEYLHDFSEQTGIAVKVKMDDEAATRLAPRTEVQLIRIIQEALANVRKHARAGRAWVTFDTEPGSARVTIQDDGQGFDSEQVRRDRTSFGLEAMRERAELVGGTVRVESQPGKGTQIIVRLPLPGEEVV